jgi:hypothetical protein
MSAIKDILDKIDKLSPADQERLKTILFGTTLLTTPRKVTLRSVLSY